MTTYERLSIIVAFLNVIATYGYLALIYYGIRTMKRTYERLYGGSERKHNEFMAESRRREEESKRRHEEAMADIRRRKQEGIRRHEESMAALRELIERTS